MVTLVGLWHLRARRWWSAGILLTLMGMLWIFSNRGFANWFVNSVEIVVPDPSVGLEPVPGHTPIVILGGGYRVYALGGSGIDLAEAGDRLTSGLELASERPEAPVIVGSHRVEGNLGHGLERFFSRWEIDEGRVWTMDSCRDTHDEALELRRLADREGFEAIILVTSAYHMRRAQAVIQAQGLGVYPHPVDYDRSLSKYSPIWPDEGALLLTRRAWREILGLGIYRLRGWL